MLTIKGLCHHIYFYGQDSIISIFVFGHNFTPPSVCHLVHNSINGVAAYEVSAKTLPNKPNVFAEMVIK